MRGEPDCEQLKEMVCGNIFIRPGVLTLVGESIPGHTHNFDHTTFVTRGRVRITQHGGPEAGRVLELGAGEWCLVVADVRHEITALEPDSRFCCIYAHRTPQGEVVQVATGWEAAYH